MLRFNLLLSCTLALLGTLKSVEAQSRFVEIEPASRPQLELSLADGESEDRNAADQRPAEDNGRDNDILNPANEQDDAGSDATSEREDDADSELNTEEGQIQSRRLTDDVIRDNWPEHSIHEISLSLAEVGRVPKDRSELLEGFGRVGPVSYSAKVFAWEAPGIRYQPLYFEDVALERYGQTLTDYRQAIRSAVRFGTAMTGLSFQMLETHPQSCDYPLGYCRPGSCVPQTTQRHFFGALSLD